LFLIFMFIDKKKAAQVSSAAKILVSIKL